MNIMSHERIEKSVVILGILTFFAVIWGGLVQIVPLFFDQKLRPEDGYVKPYDPLRLAGELGPRALCGLSGHGVRRRPRDRRPVAPRVGRRPGVEGPHPARGPNRCGGRFGGFSLFGVVISAFSCKLRRRSSGCRSRMSFRFSG